MPDEALTNTATRIAVYGYPLLYNLDEIAKLGSGESTLVDEPAAGYNEFGRARHLLGPDTEFVSPNNDTLYVMAALDLSGGPIHLHVPDTDGRYYVLQFVDAWTNNVAYVGRRATGTAAGDYLLVPTGSDSTDTPTGWSTVEVPSDIAVIVGRVQVDGDDDLAAAHAVQDGFTLQPVDPSPQLAGIAGPDPAVRSDLVWWERLRVALAQFPPPAADADILVAAATLGLSEAESPYVDPDDALADALVAGHAAAQAIVDAAGGGSGDQPTGWTSALHMFDYNLDRCGPGTRDDASWKIPDRDRAYATRAAVARGGLWGNHGYEAAYDFLWTDEDDEPLDGSRRYAVTFSPPPPVGAFWSLTMYSLPEFYLVDNPIDRYSIGDRTPGLITDDDGSVTIVIQHESPGPDLESNWLPSPEGRFRPILRSYLPGAAILDGAYAYPPVRRLDRP